MLLSPTQLGHLYNILYGNISIYELFVSADQEGDLDVHLRHQT